MLPTGQQIDSSSNEPDDFGHHTRRCRLCDAWLCRYNPRPICWHHRPQGEEGVLIEVAPDEWRRFEVVSETTADLRELMEAA